MTNKNDSICPNCGKEHHIGFDGMIKTDKGLNVFWCPPCEKIDLKSDVLD